MNTIVIDLTVATVSAIVAGLVLELMAQRAARTPIAREGTPEELLAGNVVTVGRDARGGIHIHDHRAIHHHPASVPDRPQRPSTAGDHPSNDLVVWAVGALLFVVTYVAIAPQIALALIGVAAGVACWAVAVYIRERRTSPRWDRPMTNVAVMVVAAVGASSAHLAGMTVWTRGGLHLVDLTDALWRGGPGGGVSHALNVLGSHGSAGVLAVTVAIIATALTAVAVVLTAIAVGRWRASLQQRSTPHLHGPSGRAPGAGAAVAVCVLAVVAVLCSTGLVYDVLRPVVRAGSPAADVSGPSAVVRL